MKIALAGFTLAAMLFAGSLVTRDALKGPETEFTRSFRTHEMEILAFPSGLYVDGIGVFFTSEISLTYAPMANPFQQVFPPEYKERIHATEMKQLPILREEMKQFMLASAVTLKGLPASEQIILGVKISHQLWEDKSGLPEQVVMQGVKSKLLDAKLGKSSADAAIRIQEQ